MAASLPLLPVRRVDLNSIGTAGALGGLGLLWSLPFLWTAHWYPLPALYNDLVAVSCLGYGMLCCALLKRADARLQWPLPGVLTGLVVVAALQWALGLLAYAELFQRFVLFVMAVLAAYVFGRQIIALGRTREALGVLSGACLVAAIFSVLVQWLQLFDVEFLPFWLAPVYKSGVVQSRPFGNLAQANHQATFLGLAAISAVYLGRISGRSWLAPALLLPLASGVALTGSRMGAGFLVLLVLAQFAPSGLRPPEPRSRGWACFAMAAGYAVGLVALRWAVGSIEALARPMGMHYEVWWQAWQIAWQHPWLGMGTGQFGGGQYWVGRAGPFTLAANNAHNLILGVAAELGWPAALAVGALGLYWGTRQLRQRLASPEQTLIWGMLLMVGIHSLLEYPLWYLYFALPSAVLFAFGEPALTWHATIDVRRILPAVGAVALAIVVMYNVAYREIVAAAAPQWLEAQHIRKRTALDALAAMDVADDRLFAPEVDRVLADLKHPPDEAVPGARLERCARLLRVLPAPEIVAQYIVELARAGRFDEAIRHVGRLRVYAQAGYPGYRDYILDETRDLGPPAAPLRRTLREPH